MPTNEDEGQSMIAESAEIAQTRPGKEAKLDEVENDAEDEESHEAEQGAYWRRDDDEFGMVVLGDSFENGHVQIDIVAVHGLNGEREGTWSGESEWNQGLKLLDEWDKRVLAFGYDTSDCGTEITTRNGIRKIALKLLDELLRLRDPSDSEGTRAIAFLMHDLGGIVVKEALRIAAYESRYASVRDRTRLLIFFDCPHRCASRHELEDQLARLLLDKEPRSKGIWRRFNEIAELGRSISEVNGSFNTASLPPQLDVVNIYSEGEDVFDKYTTTSSTANFAFKTEVGSSESHQDVCRFGRNSSVYEAVARAIGRSLEDPIHRDPILETFCSLATRINLPEANDSSSNDSSWLSQHETYASWLRSRGPSILHVFGSTGVSDAATELYRSLEVYGAVRNEKIVLVYFNFARHDNRRNSATPMLNTLLSLLFRQHPESYEFCRTMCKQMRTFQSWTQTDLSYLFENVLQFGDPQPKIFAILDRLDHCDESQSELLRVLCDLASSVEGRFKVAITSISSQQLKSTLADWPSIDLDGRVSSGKIGSVALAPSANRELKELLQQCRALLPFEGEVRHILLRCGEDQDWQKTIFARLKSSMCDAEKSAIRQELELLRSTSLTDTFVRTLTMLQSEQRTWARKALIWVVYSVRPLTVWELGVALALETDRPGEETFDIDKLICNDVEKDLQGALLQVFTIRDNEVYLRHPYLRDYIDNLDGKQEHIWYDVKATAHQHIVNTFAFYLSSTATHLSRGTRASNPAVVLSSSYASGTPYSLCEYAIMYWPKHCELIPNPDQKTQCGLQITCKTNVMRSWSQALWWLSNPVTRTDRSSQSVLPAIAMTGLQDLMNEKVHCVAQSSMTSQDRALALTEAARNARCTVVRILLACASYGQEALQDALIAGATSGDADVLNELTSFAVRNHENFQWPSILLPRASKFGFESVVERVLNAGTPIDVDIREFGLMAIYIAAANGQAGVARMLLEKGASVTKGSGEYDRNPLLGAAEQGHKEILRLLLNAGAKLDAVDVDGFDAMELAVYYGCHTVVRPLVEAGYDITQVDNCNWWPLSTAVRRGYINIVQELLREKSFVGREWPHSSKLLDDAVDKEDMELCRLLLEKGANVKAMVRSDSVLHRCASQGKLQMIKLLLEHGANIDMTGLEGSTALHNAVRGGYQEVAGYLLERGADVNPLTDLGESPLLLAARHVFPELVQLLIGKGAEVQRADDEGWTPLLMAYDSMEITRILLDNGADINCAVGGRTPLYYAAMTDCPEVVKLLLSRGARLEEKDSTGPNALTIAVERNNGDIARLLLDAGADINCRSDEGYTALHVAVIKEEEENVRALLEYQPDLDVRDHSGDSALNCLTLSTPLSLVRRLINRGADPEIPNDGGTTAICKALIAGNHDVAKYLVMNKVNLQVIDRNYGSPLHIACRKRNKELVQALVAAGADVNLLQPPTVGVNIGTPLEVACFNVEDGEDDPEQEQIIRYLLEDAKADVAVAGGCFSYALIVACGWATPASVTLLLKNDANVNVEDEMGRKPVHLAAFCCLQSLELLLEAGANVEARNDLGMTVLHWAVIGGNTDVIERVLSLKKDLLDQPDVDGWTPLLWATRNCQGYGRPKDPPTRRKVVELLLAKGASISVRGKGAVEEWSPVKTARYNGFEDAVVQLLLDQSKGGLAKDGEESEWDEAAHKAKEARATTWYCDCCLLDIVGIIYICRTCNNFGFCHKCYRSRDLIHDDHEFDPLGPEYDSESEGSENGKDDNDDSEDSTETSSENSDNALRE